MSLELLVQTAHFSSLLLGDLPRESFLSFSSKKTFFCLSSGFAACIKSLVQTENWTHCIDTFQFTSEESFFGQNTGTEPTFYSNLSQVWIKFSIHGFSRWINPWIEFSYSENDQSTVEPLQLMTTYSRYISILPIVLQSDQVIHSK